MFANDLVRVIYPSITTDILTGLALHHLIFRHGEWDFAGPLLVAKLIYISVPSLSIVVSVAIACGKTAILLKYLYPCIKHGIITLAAMVFSILWYRCQFHRLRGFPGPLGARLSVAYIMWKTAKSAMGFELIRDYHEKHGDFVRVGPCELSISHPDAINALYSAQSHCIKGPWYDILQPYRSLFGVRERTEHRRRRKVWHDAFQPKAINAYELLMEPCINEFISLINRSAEFKTPVDMTKTFGCLTFDIIGAISFGESFNSLSSGKPHYMMEYLHKSNLSTGVMIRAVWLIFFLRQLPVFSQAMQQIIDFTESAMKQRLSKSENTRDVFTWLWEDHRANAHDSAEENRNLVADASLSIFAGSDTVSITMTGILYYLMCHPDYQVKLLQEFLSAEREHGVLTAENLASLPLLNAVINETLRLHYPGPSGFPRITPPEGVQIGDTFIPGGVHVKVPIYTVYRDSRNFAQPEAFIPERWTTKKELVLQPQAFAPFLIGPYNCVGKQLALSQIRLVTYKILRVFEVLPLSQKELVHYWNHRADGFNLGLGPLKTMFKHRTNPLEGDGPSVP